MSVEIRIIKDVVDSHEGWITAESENVKGTMVVFSLPSEPPWQELINA